MSVIILEEIDKLSKLEKLELAKYLLNEVSKKEIAHTPTSTEKSDPIIGYEVDGSPLFASVAKKRFQAEVQLVRQGEYTTIEDLEKEAETW